MRQAMRSSGARTKRAVVEDGRLPFVGYRKDRMFTKVIPLVLAVAMAVAPASREICQIRCTAADHGPSDDHAHMHHDMSHAPAHHHMAGHESARTDHAAHGMVAHGAEDHAVPTHA